MTELVIPAWVDTLLGRRTIASFADELTPDDDDKELVLGIAEEIERKSQWPVRPELAARYLEEIGWQPGMPFVAADRLRASPAHRALHAAVVAELGTQAVTRALRSSASVDLAGDDPFASYSLPGHAYYDAAFFQFYGRLHSPPRCQVAGSKNSYHFLRLLFSLTYQADRGVYDCEALPSVAPELRELIESLFFSTRTVPCVWVTDRNATWPGGNDPRLQGVLSPREVQQLVPYLDQLEELDRELAQRYELLPLFADRVRRAAEQGLALVTLFDCL